MRGIRDRRAELGGVHVESPSGETLLTIQEEKLRVRDTMEIERDGRAVAEVPKRRLRVRDTYGIEVAPGEDDALIPAVVVCIDRVSHD
jgi:uncharacterized protein YxjI